MYLLHHQVDTLDPRYPSSLAFPGVQTGLPGFPGEQPQAVSTHDLPEAVVWDSKEPAPALWGLMCNWKKLECLS